VARSAEFFRPATWSALGADQNALQKQSKKDPLAIDLFIGHLLMSSEQTGTPEDGILHGPRWDV
jgi:hypothetical protein